MEAILIVILLPELLAIAIGLFMVAASLNGCGDWARLIPQLGTRRKKVASGYWGCYTGASTAAGPTIKVPKIVMPQEYEHGEPDWRG